ncbi:hypothetical protein BCV69DRAFT_268306, partial [Microstroma glucosiphilum]
MSSAHTDVGPTPTTSTTSDLAVSDATLSANAQWQPLPKIHYGFAISTFSPEAEILHQAARTLDETSVAALRSHLVTLEVGDEVYVFEQLGQDKPQWYRGFIVSTLGSAALASTALVNRSEARSSMDSPASAGLLPSEREGLVEEPQVFVGMFPAGHIYIKELLEDAENKLGGIYAHARALQQHSTTQQQSSRASSISKSQMETLPEEDESPSFPNSPRDAELAQMQALAEPLSTYAEIDHEIDSRPAPPLPSLKCSDETISGAEEPLVDEIACALREWGSLAYTYLVERNYNLFNTVRRHIEALHAARRQLLAHNLSEEETVKLRRECVARLVKGNIAQGLEVIVRHPDKGGLVDIDVSGATVDLDNWISGVRLYALQVALAYVDRHLQDASAGDPQGHVLLSGLSGTLLNTPRIVAETAPGKTEPSSSRPATASEFLSASSSEGTTSPTSSIKYYHVFLEVRAFVASPCAAGETAELYFALYSRGEARFLTEEYCIVLNHHGVPAGQAEDRRGKMCTLFTELSAADLQDLDVVCRIVRNGSMKVSSGSAESRSLNTLSAPDEVHDQEVADQLIASTQPQQAALVGTPGFRKDRMVGDRSFRRPFGCAVLSLGSHHHFDTAYTSSSARKEHVMPIFIPVKEAAFSTLHQDIIASRVGEFEKSTRAEMIAVDVKVFHGQSDTLVMENPSILSSAALTARLGFPDVVFPGDERNEAYIKLWSGEFFPSAGKMSTNSSARNIQVSIEVRTRDGQVLENVISRGAGEPPVTQFDSITFHRQNAPTWGELIKLRLPKDLTHECHLFLSFRHRSSKEDRSTPSSATFQANPSTAATSKRVEPTAPVSVPFAHAYLPLYDTNSAFLQDGPHTLLIWKPIRPAHQLSPEVYFSLPATVPSPSHGGALTEGLAAGLPGLLQLLPDTVTLRTFLVSTRFTQNETLLRLLHWERQLGASSNFEELRTVLTQFTFVGEVEVVKFLSDIFDALFAIVMHPKNSDGGLDDLVSKALVTVLSIVQDRRFNNFRATLDAYIDKHFSFQAAHSRLMDSMARLLADPGRSDASKDLRASIKVWPYLFRFIIKGRENQRRANDEGNAVGGGAVDDHLETKFRSDLDAILRSINRLMAATSPPSIVGTQALALQHFAGVLPHLAKVFTLTDLVSYECSFADSLFVTKGRMVIWKLLHIIQVVDGPLFDHDASRAELVPSVVRSIRPHLGPFDDANAASVAATPSKASQDGAKDTARITWIESARLALTVLAVVLDRVQTSIADLKKVKTTGAQLRIEQDSVDYVLPLLPRILETYRELESEECIGALERHRSPSTIASEVPVIFPSAYPFPLISQWPDEQQSKTSGVHHSDQRRGKQTRLNFLHCGLGESATVLIMLIMLSPRKHLAEFLDEQSDLGGPDQLSPFLTSFCAVATSILRNDAFPAAWLNINILAHQMVLKMADPLSALLVRDFIPTREDPGAFDKILWHDCLNMFLALLSSEQLVVEQFKPQRRRAVWRLAGDIRGEGAQIFAKLWNSIGQPDRSPSAEAREEGAAMLNTGGFQVHFVPDLVEPVLQLCLSHHDELRTCAVRVLATMITTEWHLSGSFATIEGEIIDKLDALFRCRSKGDEISRVFFIGQLRSFFDNPDTDQALQEQISTCLISVNRFLDLLLNVRSLPPAEGFDDDRVAGTLKLLGFLRQANRVTAFSAHVLRLVNVHLNSHSYIEAALTLKLHADLLTWEPHTFMDPLPELSLPRQTNFARKEKLYMLILDYLSMGEAWEIAVDICREFAQQYEYVAVDYVRLSEILAYQAGLFGNIATQERTFPSYFRIAFWGSGWPELLQQKMFIYRGLDWEKLSTFAERLQQKHPAAILLKTSADVGDDVKYSEAQYLQVTAVQPEPDRNRDAFTNAEVPHCVRSYYEHNATNLFSFTRPLRPEDGRRDPSLSSSPRKSLLAEVWVEKTFLRCEDAFPTVLRRSEVVDVHVTEISPIQHALDDVEAKTVELVGLEKRCAKASQGGAKVDTNRLAMTLNGAVDAPLNGGIPLYRRTFLDESEGIPPQDADLAERLRRAIDQHASTLCRCLKIHARLCAPEMKPFHDALEGFFAKNFAEEIQRLNLTLEEIDDAG